MYTKEGFISRYQSILSSGKIGHQNGWGLGIRNLFDSLCARVFQKITFNKK